MQLFVVPPIEGKTLDVSFAADICLIFALTRCDKCLLSVVTIVLVFV
jgi:hypothetical protein